MGCIDPAQMMDMANQAKDAADAGGALGEVVGEVAGDAVG